MAIEKKKNLYEFAAIARPTEETIQQEKKTTKQQTYCQTS